MGLHVQQLTWLMNGLALPAHLMYVTGPIWTVTFDHGVSNCTPVRGESPQYLVTMPPMRLSQAERPLQIVAVDIGLPVIPNGIWFILVVEDYFTKFIKLYAIPYQGVTTVAECLFQDYILEHGVMETLHTDMGGQFESVEVNHLSIILRVKKTHTTP